MHIKVKNTYWQKFIVCVKVKDNNTHLPLSLTEWGCTPVGLLTKWHSACGK